MFARGKRSELGWTGIAATMALALMLSMPPIAAASPSEVGEQAPSIDESFDPSDESGLPYYMQNWDLMEPIFDPFNTELGNYAVNWEWNQENAEGVVYYLEEASTQDFLAPNITKHTDTRVLMTGRPNGTYWYRVMAAKGGQYSNWSRSDSITISIRPIDPDDDMGIIVHDYHKNTYKLPYLTEKIELFLNVPVAIRVGDDPDTTKRYVVTLRQIVHDPIELAVFEIDSPHQFVVVTNKTIHIDMDGDGVLDMAVQNKGQHVNGQVYIAFTLIDKTSVAPISYATVCAVAAAIAITTYILVRVWRLRAKNKVEASKSRLSEKQSS